MKKYICFSLFLILCLLLIGCQTMDREYLPDLTIDMETRDAQLVIREWSFLLGSGAEVYYRENGKYLHLGNCTGADDGYTPFAGGLYEIIEYSNAIHIRWFFTSGQDGQIWHEKTFSLPG